MSPGCSGNHAISLGAVAPQLLIEAPQDEVKLDFPRVKPGLIISARVSLWDPLQQGAGPSEGNR